ncbi:GTP cyclohydrolase I [Bradyrhizobium sp. 76]|uniref:GTP cyclohydrolase I n=1 Tax=Bradyrhizobium sp. 76 TaxID=2782680 RepID=UPI001FFB5D2E|nr:GTP cyclohydrolase I [Bradyrhizobium sp. 76]MCK1406880.1 GTP cyclohydrolase I [Bradyrhizobium sp. 76]
MRLPDLSTPQPTLVIREPGCPDLAGFTAGARRALLSASLGSLRPGGSGWFGPDKLHRMWVGVLPGVGDRYQQSCACGQLDHGAPAIQEEADIMLADELERRINPNGLAVIVTARHQCVIWRGVRETETTMVTSIMRRVSATARYCVANFWRSSRTKP